MVEDSFNAQRVRLRRARNLMTAPRLSNLHLPALYEEGPLPQGLFMSAIRESDVPCATFLFFGRGRNMDADKGVPSERGSQMFFGRRSRQMGDHKRELRLLDGRVR